jgi:hypothetical protein
MIINNFRMVEVLERCALIKSTIKKLFCRTKPDAVDDGQLNLNKLSGHK